MLATQVISDLSDEVYLAFAANTKSSDAAYFDDLLGHAAQYCSNGFIIRLTGNHIFIPSTLSSLLWSCICASSRALLAQPVGKVPHMSQNSTGAARGSSFIFVMIFN